MIVTWRSLPDPSYGDQSQTKNNILVHIKKTTYLQKPIKLPQGKQSRMQQITLMVDYWQPSTTFILLSPQPVSSRTGPQACACCQAICLNTTLKMLSFQVFYRSKGEGALVSELPPWRDQCHVCMFL